MLLHHQNFIGWIWTVLGASFLSTSTGCLCRWTKRNPASGRKTSEIGGVEAPELVAGNSANAAAVADANAKRVSAYNPTLLTLFDAYSTGLKASFGGFQEIWLT